MKQWADIEEIMNEIHGGNDLVSILSVETTESEVLCEGADSSVNGTGQDEDNVEKQPFASANDDSEMISLAKLPTETVTFEPHDDVGHCKTMLQFRCADCGYVTNRSNTLSTHQAETCEVRRRKGLLAPNDKKCKYCLKEMRHNALRSHLRHFIKSIKANRRPKGKHASVSLSEFEDYLNEIKMN